MKRKYSFKSYMNNELISHIQDYGTISVSNKVIEISISTYNFMIEKDRVTVTYLEPKENKFVFDKERTIDTFEIKGQLTKVYSTDKNVQNYVGSLSSILDNEDGEDAFCYLILSANIKDYTLTAKYSDSTSSVVKVKIDARLVTAVSE